MSAAVWSSPSRTRWTEVEIAGKACLLDPSGALFLVDESMLVVADLHLEKGSNLARGGSLMPPYDTTATIAKLSCVIADYMPKTVTALGDSFHDQNGPGRLSLRDQAVLTTLVSCRDWVWVAGNHDPKLPRSVGGVVADAVMLGSLEMRHCPGTGAKYELSGHLHPVVRSLRYCQFMRGRTFIRDKDRCVLPAFGSYTGGLDIWDPAFRRLFSEQFTVDLLGQDRIFSVDGRYLPNGG